MDIDDSTILARIKEGDQEAFGFLYKSYAPRLLRYASHFTLNSDIAEDLVHECFISFWEKRKQIKPLSLRSLLFTMTRNACLNYLKHENLIEKKTLDHLMEHEGEERLYNLDFQHTPESALLLEELRAQIQAVMDSLPPRSREVFSLSRIHGLKNREIAEQLSISDTAVEKHIAKALRLFFINFKDKEYLLVIIFLKPDLLCL